MIKNILLDLDNTILDFSFSEKKALSKTLQHLGLDPKEEILHRYSELNVAQWRLLEQGVITREEVMTRRYKILFDEIGVSCSPEAATKYYEKKLSREYCFVPGAREILKVLTRSYRLYLVSNGSVAVQKGRIRRARIMKYFSGIFLSQQIGYEKPNPEFFNYCFKQIPEFKKAETIIIGDSLTSDIKGGINTGIKTVWFNPGKSLNNENIKPDYEISKLTDFIPLLNTINMM